MPPRIQQIREAVTRWCPADTALAGGVLGGNSLLSHTPLKFAIHMHSVQSAIETGAIHNATLVPPNQYGRVCPDPMDEVISFLLCVRRFVSLPLHV